MNNHNQKTRCANARRCALDGECRLSRWKHFDMDPFKAARNWIAPPPCSRPSPHLCGWYGEGRERG